MAGDLTVLQAHMSGLGLFALDDGYHVFCALGVLKMFYGSWQPR